MATHERQIETPVGPQVGKIFATFEILGIASFLTQSGNQSNAHKIYEELVNIEVPVGTQVVVPSPNLWSLGYGNTEPEMLDPLDDNQSASWHSEDHNWGLGWFQISAVDLNAPDFSQNPPKQTAQLRIAMVLSDDNGDDSWFGIAGYTLLFLGHAPRPPRPTGGEPLPTGRRMLWKATKLR
jgi:hypothetical protein